MNQYLITLMFVLPALLAQHLIHEYAHVVAAKIFDVKVIRIQWITYKGGTKVFFENEPDFFNDSAEIISKKWAWISIAGYLVTNVIGYFLVLIFLLLENGWVKGAVCYFCIIFLIVDSLYFLLGSILNFGDIVGARKTLYVSRRLSIIGTSIILALNLALINKMFY